jgi:hypothetical protein
MPDPTAVPSEGGALAEAEEWLRSLVGGRSYTARALAVLLAEYDRRGVAEAALDDAGLVIDDMRAELSRCRKVVQAATAYIDECESPAPDLTYRAQLRRALAAEVAALPDTEGRD